MGKKTGARRYGNPAKRQVVAGDLQRLAAPNGLVDATRLGGGLAGPGGPRDQGAVLLSIDRAVLLDACHVATMDTVRGGSRDGQAIYMTLAGRINKSTDRAQVGFIFPPDGAAAIITELLALADRHGAELLDELTGRLTSLSQRKVVDLHFLRAAIDNAIDAAEQQVDAAAEGGGGG